MNCNATKGLWKGKKLRCHWCSCALAYRNISVLSTGELRSWQTVPKIVRILLFLCKSEVLMLYEKNKEKPMRHWINLIFKQASAGGGLNSLLEQLEWGLKMLKQFWKCHFFPLILGWEHSMTMTNIYTHTFVIRHFPFAFWS